MYWNVEMQFVIAETAAPGISRLHNRLDVFGVCARVQEEWKGSKKNRPTENEGRKKKEIKI